MPHIMINDAQAYALFQQCAKLGQKNKGYPYVAKMIRLVKAFEIERIEGEIFDNVRLEAEWKAAAEAAKADGKPLPPAPKYKLHTVSAAPTARDVEHEDLAFLYNGTRGWDADEIDAEKCVIPYPEDSMKNLLLVDGMFRAVTDAWNRRLEGVAKPNGRKVKHLEAVAD